MHTKKLAVFNRPEHYGYTLIELAITMLIIGVLAAIAVPAYSKVYVQRAKFTEVIAAVAPIKLAIELCYQINNNSLLFCDNDSTSTPIGKITDGELRSAKNGRYVSEVRVHNNTAIIEASGSSEVYSASYILTPVESLDSSNKKTGGLTWTASGTCTGLYLC